MKLVDFGIPELTDDQIEEICAAAENAARKFVLSKVSLKQIDRLDIVVEAEGAKPIDFGVEVDLLLVPEAKTADQKTLAEEAVKEAFNAIENCLRKLR